MIRGVRNCDLFSHEKAKNLFGNGDFFGPHEWERLGITLSDDFLRTYNNLPWSEVALRSHCPFAPGDGRICDTHFLFLCPQNVCGQPLSLSGLKLLSSQFGATINSSLPHPSLIATDYRHDTCEVGWHLIAKNVLPRIRSITSSTMIESENGPQRYQKFYLPCSPIDIVMMHLLFIELTGHDLNPADYYCSNALDGNERCIVVGCCQSVIQIMSVPQKSLPQNVGLGVCRLPEIPQNQ